MKVEMQAGGGGGRRRQAATAGGNGSNSSSSSSSSSNGGEGGEGGRRQRRRRRRRRRWRWSGSTTTMPNRRGRTVDGEVVAAPVGWAGAGRGDGLNSNCFGWQQLALLPRVAIVAVVGVVGPISLLIDGGRRASSDHLVASNQILCRAPSSSSSSLTATNAPSSLHSFLLSSTEIKKERKKEIEMSSWLSFFLFPGLVLLTCTTCPSISS